jgi:hypothetical protein
VTACDAAQFSLSVNRALPVFSSWPILFSVVEVLRRLAVPWTIQLQWLAWWNARHVSPRGCALFLPAQIRLLALRAPFLRACLPEPAQWFLVLA